MLYDGLGIRHGLSYFMRFAICLFVLVLIPVYAVVLEWNFAHFQQPHLLLETQELLAAAGLGDVQVVLNHFDATLSGICREPADRARALALVVSVRGLRVREDDNLIRLPARVQAKIEEDTLVMEGWLPSETSRRVITAMVAEFRPELKVNTEAVRLLPLVELGPTTPFVGVEVPVVFSTLLDSIRAPAALSITPQAKGVEVRGYLPTPDMRVGIVQAIEKSGAGRKVDATNLHVSPHLMAAPFVKGTGLVDFVRSFFATPAPGTFSIDSRNGPRLTAHATVAMESEWLRLLRPITGSMKVNMNITRVPSRYHLPGYQPVSKLPPEWLSWIRAQSFLFDDWSPELTAADEEKLEPLAYLMMEAGPELRVLVAGYSDPLGEPGGETLRLRRANLIRQRLLDYGVPPEVVQAEGFDAVRVPGVQTDEQGRAGRSVEFFVK